MTLRLRGRVDVRGCVRVVHRVVWSVVCGTTLSPMSHPWLERKHPQTTLSEGGVCGAMECVGMLVYLIARQAVCMSALVWI
jgi:hypothetical protein